MVLNFDEVVLFSEDIDEFGAGLAGIDLAIVHQVLRHERGETARKSD